MPDTPYTAVTTLSDNGGDDDSLFGSPPSSPARGRSPSPLALPGGTGSAQNVGALALPGSHLVAELPTNPPASLPLSASAFAPSRQSSVPRAQVQPSPSTTALQPHAQSQPRASSSKRSTPGPSRATRAENTTRKTRKGKEKAHTPRPTPPPIPLPSPDEPPPPNFLRNQQALLGLAGMVGGVNPANLAKARHTRGTTAENPIVVEDEPQVQQQPSIGKRPTFPTPSDPSQLPRPTSEQILLTLLKQKNIFPVVVSLLRLLAPGAPSLAAVPPGYPYYSHPYPYPYPYPPQPQTQPQSTAQSSSQSSAADSRPSTSSGAPPLKRRKLNSVPAGAADWDVPYPFQEGQGPENYRAVWEQERGKQLLKDLVQLVQNAARKAATKAWYQQHAQRRYPAPAPSVLKYYRPATLYYGLERGQSAPPPSAQSQTRSSHSRSETPGTSTPLAGAPHAQMGGGLPHAPVAFSSGAPSLPQHVDGMHQPPNAFDQLVESLLAAQQQQQQRQQDEERQRQAHPEQQPAASASSGDQSSSSSTQPCSSLQPGPSAQSLSTSEESTQAFFDNWLEMLATFPPGDPNEASVGTDSPAPAATSVAPDTPRATNTDVSNTTTAAAHTSASTMQGTTSAPMLISNDMIDPALLGEQMQVDIPSTSNPANTAAVVSTASHATNSASGPNAASSTNAQPATPSLVDSPSVTASSLAERDADGDTGPATPSWDWAFSDAQDAATAAEGMKLLDELAGMDVDVDLDAVMRETFGGWDAMGDLVVGVQGDAGTIAPAQTQTEQQARPHVEVGARAEGQVNANDHPTEPSTTRKDSALLVPSTVNDTPQFAPHQPSEKSVLNAVQPSSTQNASVPSVSTPSAPPPPASQPLAPLLSASNVPPPRTPIPTPPLAASAARSARAKGKAKAIPSTGNGVAPGLGTGKAQNRRAIIERARAMRAALAGEVERAKVALWETTLEQGVLVGLGRELEKAAGGGGGNAGAGGGGHG